MHVEFERTFTTQHLTEHWSATNDQLGITGFGCSEQVAIEHCNLHVNSMLDRLSNNGLSVVFKTEVDGQNWFYITDNDLHIIEENISETMADRALFRWIDAIQVAEKQFPGVTQVILGAYVDQLREDFKNPDSSFLPRRHVKDVPVDAKPMFPYNHPEAENEEGK